MSEVRFVQILLQDPLSRTSRQERSRLLLASLSALVVAKAGIIPTKIAALGLEFTPSNRKAMIVLIGIVVLYFLIAFATYAFFDIILAISTGGEANTREIAESKQRYPNIQFGGVAPSTRRLFLFRAVLFEFGLPVVVAIYAIACLLLTK